MAEQSPTVTAVAADTILQVEGVTAGYAPDVDILHGVDLRLGREEIVSIIGPNGAGKSTLVKAIFGLVPVREGSVTFDGESIANERPDRLVARGLAYVPQRENVFPRLTVRENLQVGGILDRAKIGERMERIVELFPRLGERAGQAAGTLSGGERQMVAFGRALMSGPRVLLLDEPSAGLAPAVVNEVFETIATINREQKIAVLLVEQNARRALAMSHRGYVLDTGQNAHTGVGSDLLHDPKVAELYLGVSRQQAR